MRFFPTVLNPKTYRSPAGTYALTVEPSDMSGKGEASYRLTGGDQVVWARELPFTLWHAAVTDDGLAGGYAYSEGYDSLAAGDFRIVLLDQQGNVRMDQADRRALVTMHGPALPYGLGLFLDPANDRMVVRVNAPADDDRETWQTYRLSDGADTGRFRPQPPVPKEYTGAFVVDARPVAGTPLTLVHWHVTEYKSPPARNRSGARFALIDSRGRSAWHVDLPHCHGADVAAAEPLAEPSDCGAILRADQPGRFDIRCIADRARVTFAVGAGPEGGWSVREIGRAPDSPPEVPMVEVPVIPLKSLQRFRTARLVPERPKQAVRDVMGLAVDGRGRLVFLRGARQHGHTLVILDQTGQLVSEVDLTADAMRKYGRPPHFAWVGGDRFVVVYSDWRTERADAWWVDALTGQVSAVVGFDCQEVKGLAGAGDGGFVALVDWSEQLGSGYSPRSAVHRFDAAGRRVWSLPADYSREPGKLFSPTDIAVTSTGRVAVLDVIRRNVSVFDAAGTFEQVIDLTATLGHKPNYPCRLTADLEGGMVVEDFHGSSPILRLHADGTVHEQLTARFADGRTSTGLQSVRVAPDGRLWTTDGHALLRLALDGTVDAVVGGDPDVTTLGTIATLAVDGRGGVYAVDGRTGTVHAFDSVGSPVRQFRPGPSDFDIGLRSPDLTVSGTGEVFLGDHLETRWLRFAADGTRLGWESNLFDDVTETWHFVPGGTRRWVRTYHDVRLVDGERTVVRTIARRPDGNWLESPTQVAVADDGSAAVGSGPVNPSQTCRPIINLYTRDGDPIRTFALPPPVGEYDPLAYGGDHLAVWTNAGIVLFDATGRPLWRFTPAVDPGEGLRHLFLINGGRVLLVYDGRQTVDWYAMP
jgi:hypothetical protein